MIAAVQVTSSIQPGVVTFAHGYGHWATGAADTTIDGKIIKGDNEEAPDSTPMQPCGPIRT